jgi:hypothetical protein
MPKQNAEILQISPFLGFFAKGKTSKHPFGTPFAYRKAKTKGQR